MPSFITELKKRKVFNSAAIYLATAFVILQAAQIIIPALLIPEWTLRLLVVLAILGFPVIIILSWIYDVGEKGIVKTDPIKSDDGHEAGMAKSSILGIIASIAITIFMVYKGVDYFSNTKEVTGKTSIAVLNFDNIRKIDEYEWLGDDIAGSLSYTLGGIPEVRVIDRFQILNKLGEVDPEKASILEYKLNQIANTIDVDLILHGQFTIIDSTVKVIAVYAETKSFSQTPIMNEKYSLNELSDIPTYINDKISDFINNDPRFKGSSK